MPRIIREAGRRGCFLELNAHPYRLDLIDSYCQMARVEGVLVSINSDAHSTFDFENLRFGIGQARRGWLEKQDVLNARPLRELRVLLNRVREGEINAPRSNKLSVHSIYRWMNGRHHLNTREATHDL